MTYQFTSEQLVRLLQKTCALYETCRDMGANPSAARLTAIGEALDGLEPVVDETIDHIRQHITERLDYLVRLRYHYEANIPEPTYVETETYNASWVETHTLQAVQRVMEGGKA